ncbi:uroporphyrinogen-III synthase [Robertkochia flava]|uniref:uroporphyrinogen-III synthase n=1 Tax=Robertkochia flava TaxID=3447986 RepID=UPI001CCBA722|nr:uroporphyrinogen-III synthase [Robertkochia marina]
MAGSIRILSTKSLTTPQKERLLNAGFALVEIPFVKTETVPFSHPHKIDRAIITSQNAVKAIRGADLRIGQCFCVGEKTAAALTEAGYPPVLCESSGEQLAYALADRYKGKDFHYLGTRNRRDELPRILKEHNTPLTEIEVYRTLTNVIEAPGRFDAILFFSPSAVNAFRQKNETGNAVCFCIGPTTAKAFEGFENKVAIAAKPTAEHLILEVVKYFNPKRQHSVEQ